ncbi:alpha/beta hydrolase [Gilvimarinus polysaccharolyticus]|uniref:alpha/beta hydrolase n=1 Tax=Gilvimarinus polysaccharolyticus TaxID=863921 RepID=UPI000673B456|nr:alpha/beta hydrolase-fold protein [Gilvimarinus polysaccharolyticus]
MSLQQIEQSGSSLSATNQAILTVHASSLNGRGTISCYNVNSKQQDIPIVILLHGVYGDHWVWNELGGVHQVYQRLRANGQLDDMILVMPGDGSYYAGSGYLPLQAGPNAEQWIVTDVLEAVIRSIHGASKNSNVYLSGLSMGGYGALRLGAKYPDKFQGISAHSAITQLQELSLFINEALSIYRCEASREPDILYWMQRHRHQLPPLRFDCGQDDPLHSGNLAFSQQLKHDNIKHSFTSLEGAHEWSYWNTNVERSLLFFQNLEHPPQ